MSSLLDTLTEMGFPREKAEKALSCTGGTNLEHAINWIISHPDDDAPSAARDGRNVVPVPDVAPKVIEESTVEITMEEPAPVARMEQEVQEPKSLKCEDCGKLFRNEDEVQFHAVKSGHTNFSESTDEVKPLSEEEKRARMLALQERLKKKRTEKEEEEKKQALDLEKQRRLTGQQMLAAKQRIEEMELKKIAEDKKRQKKEDALTKKRILDQIKMDREAKKQEQAGTGASVSTEPKPAVAAASVPAPDSNAQAATKDYDHCQLQAILGDIAWCPIESGAGSHSFKIRLLNGKTLKQTFGAKEPLSAVRLYVQLQSGDITEPFTFMTNFPRRVFNDEDMETPLIELSLVPAAVLIMTRKP